MVRRQNDLGKDDIKLLVRRLAIPSMLAQFVNVLYSIVDRMYIGNIPQVGEVALAGAGVCGPIVTLISSFAFLVGIGGAPLMAIRMGEDNQEGAQKILANCFVMLLALSAALTGLAIAFREPMLMFFGASEQTFPYANSYLTYYVMGTVFAILTAGLNQFITCQGFANEAMLTTIIGAVMNIILDPIFIFALDMGVTGAAIATVAGQILAMLYAVYVMVRKEHAVHITFKGFHFSGAIVRDIFQVGFPSIIMQSIGSVMIMALNNILIVFSQAAVAVLGVYFKLQSFVFMPVFGLGAGALPIMGFNYGARNKKRLMHTLQLTCAIAFGIMLVGLLIFQFGARYLLMMFNASADMMDIGISALRTISLCFPAAGLGIAFSNFFQGIGEGKNSLLISVLRQLVILLPCAWIISRIGTLNQVWLAFPIAEVFSFFVSLLLTRITYNNKIKEMEDFTTDED